MLRTVRTLLRHKVLAGAAATVVAGGITAGFVVPALAASSPAASSPAATVPSGSSPASPSTKPAHSGNPLRALALRLARETMKETGLSRATLLQDLRAGQSLDSIAGAKAGAVVNAVVAEAQSRLDAQVRAGKLTAAKEQLRLARLRSEAGAIMGMDLAPFLPAGGHAGPSATPSAGTTAA